MPTIETGVVVPNANTYVSYGDFIVYASEYGLVPNPITTEWEQPAVDPLTIRATDYIESFADCFLGCEVQPGVQPLSWPREGVYLGKQTVTEFANDAIPSALKFAVYEAMIAVLVDGVVLQPNIKAATSGDAAGAGGIAEKTVGPLTKKWHSSSSGSSSSGSVGFSPLLPRVKRHLYRLFNGGSGNRYRASRV